MSRQFDLLTDQLPLMVATVDRDLRFSYANRAYSERFDLRPDEVVGRLVVEVIGADALAAIEPYVRRVLSGERLEYERWVPYRRLGRRYIRCHYAPVILEAGGAPVGYVAAIQDETARKTAEDALAASRARFDFVADSAEIGLWSCDLPLVDLIWNPTCKAHFGLEADAPVTIDTFYERMHPDDVAPTRAAVADAVERGSHYDVEYRTLQRDGSYAWIRALGRTEHDEHGTPRRFEGVTVNITPQKRAQEQLREADLRKDEFLATLAHELRNPLAPLATAVHLLGSNPAPAVVERVRGILDRQVTQLVTLVDDLLDVSRITTGKLDLRRERTTVDAAIGAAVEACERVVRAAGHRLDVEIHGGPLAVDGDPTRLTQLVVNLLTNAAKYTPPGGAIAIRAERAGGDVRLAIRDTGIGIEPDIAGRLFEMFVQGRAARELSPGGLGIGLTLVQRLVALHGGRIDVESAGPNRGSTFTVTLPAAGASSRPATARTSAGNGVPPLKILVVDDNLDAVETLALMLRQQGHDVRVANDGLQALDVGDGFEPAAVLLDLGMPRMNGYDAAEAIRRRPWGAHALIVAMTGWGQPRDIERSQAAGIDRHLTKPVELGMLHTLLVLAGDRLRS